MKFEYKTSKKLFVLGKLSQEAKSYFAIFIDPRFLFIALVIIDKYQEL